MAEALKSFFSRSLVRSLAADLARVEPGFPASRFVAEASAGLDRLELLDRARQIARALAAHLPSDYPAALRVLMRSLPEGRRAPAAGGMSSFFFLPHVLFVAAHGLEHFDRSMRAQYELTKRFTAEFSVRAFIARDPERSWTFFRRWARDRDPHVRRLVSEGTRLRLPWAPRVAWLDQHPDRVLELLELLKDDPSEMVRRSVANNLNDLGKVHPDLLIRTAARWLGSAPPARRALVEHALRSAIKRAHPGALRLLGYGQKPSVSLDEVSFEPARVRIGERVRMRFRLRSTSRRRQDLLVDLAVHFVKARGATAKVFKIARVTLPPRARAELSTSVSLAVHTTRVPRPGRHLVDIIVNGVTMRAGSFDVMPA
jgi:3-methyladenine DNA glycosylase AlkC